MEDVRKMDLIFRSVYGEKYCKGRGVIQKMIQELEQKLPHINKHAIRLFCRVRTFTRIRFLNRNASLVSARKAAEKAKKWVKSSS